MTTRQTYDQAFFVSEGPLGLETVKYYNYPDQPFSYRPEQEQGTRDLLFRPGIDPDGIETLEQKNNRAIGYLREYVDGMHRYEQSGTDIPDFKVRSDYAQKQGGPLVEKTLMASSPFSDFDLTDEDIPTLGPVTPASMRRRQLEMFIPGFSERVRNALPNAIRKSPLGGV